ncbi:MAG: PAS domain-containing protein, partial [Bacteroidales bacterium]|nr:PAS domain-containing protein [Bacteroidales bacterium]
EIGYCLYDPQEVWTPEGLETDEKTNLQENKIMLSTGSLTLDELDAILSTLPIDITFVDKEDRVRFFSNSAERVFPRNRAILGRDVHLCHPPGSVHIVEQILSDFKSGKQNSAAFWINFHERFIYIEYFAVRNKNGEYLGTLEFTQDATKIRSLVGEQRILNYQKP